MASAIEPSTFNLQPLRSFLIYATCGCPQNRFAQPLQLLPCGLSNTSKINLRWNFIRLIADQLELLLELNNKPQ
jgi:hypothetical protein